MAEYFSTLLYAGGIGSRVISSLNAGYTGIILVLFVCYLIRSRNEFLITLLEISNCILLALAVLHILAYTETVRNCFIYSEPEQFAFYNRIFTNLWWYVVWLMAKLFLPFAFLFKRWRTTFVLPIVLVLLGYPNTWNELILSTTDSFLPSTWSYSWQTLALEHLYGFIMYGILVGFVYCCILLRRKLPTV